MYRGDLMNEEIVMLSHYLRNEGMFVSIRSTTLASIVFESLREVMTFDELHNSLKAVYVKDVGDNERFERAFKKVFNKIEFIPENTESQEEVHNITETENSSQQAAPINQNLDELQELYDEMIRYRSETEAKEGRAVDGSLLLLDNFDPRIFELCRKLSRKIANKRSARRKLT